MTARLIVLAGLVSVEKAFLAAELGTFWAQQGLSVVILDNIARIAIDPETVGGARVMRAAEDVLPHLPYILAQTDADVMILAVSETLAPDTLFTALGTLDDVRLTVLGLVDTRTCDCFPHIRAQLEAESDAVIHMPYTLDAVLALLV